MVKASRTRCVLGGLTLLWTLCGVLGLIEIVEEQHCHNYDFRLTCRDLDTHIAILEGWYTSTEDYYRNSNDTHPTKLIHTENDSELDRVFVYSSPKHNGVYELTNHSSFDNDSSSVNSSFEFDSKYLNDSWFNDTFVDAVDMAVDYVNVSEGCAVVTYSRSYGGLQEGDKRRKPVSRISSINLRAPLSYRCTGVNHCSFVLAEDYPPSKSWSPGVVYVKYACFDDLLSIHYCNRELYIPEAGPDSEGYIRTPGYPHYYVGEECRWKLRVNPQQRIRVTLLDVSLRSIGPFEEECIDFVSVEDTNGILLSTCEQVDLPLRLTSTSDTVEVVVEAKSKGAFPKRGVLLHYKSIGCVTLPAPSSGYIVYRNGDFAHYMCNVNFVFQDTLQRARVIWCYDDNGWNDTIPACIEEAAPTVAGNDSTPERSDKDTKLPHNEANMIVDIVIPSLLIAALFIGNAFIVLIIYKYRKRKNDDLEDEFNTIPLNMNGVHSAGNAV